MYQSNKAFTLIELIIVIVIVAILAATAIPKYYASVEKSKRTELYATLEAVRRAQLAYYAVYGAYPGTNTWPVIVVVDGDTIYNLSNPTNSHWRYGSGNDLPVDCAPDGRYTYGYKQPGDTCWSGLCVNSGKVVGSCT
ncbi:MAG: prepilin-type N-terminal cleavage/methylation domain-containing protein [Candidatus Omnitrophica bacterium]|nr:prepilin-type N-terminal cleavage/methylation domain-containing protein [Candidatus Omnitrophota bacterium]MDD5027062.1 prepilin-type N-terminal cleavage/methylation domain-containing protein [Candidatus Omnitrophota bacterium]MDD5662146.1 prepilin-type N-terminal cleavage/methylation domain-containing protein [Candidatus Omnitrophota bacterium]